MNKAAPFMHNYSTILFDLDGVITSEKRYWDAAVLTVYEYLNPSVSPEYAMANRDSIRKNIFYNDKLLLYLKNKGVNSNWDLTYIILSAALILGVRDDFSRVYDYILRLDLDAMGLYDFFGETGPLGKRGGKEYDNCVLVFQQWYLGDSLFGQIYRKEPRIKGKSGLCRYEEPVIALKDITLVLKTLHGEGFTLGIGSGRVGFEAVPTLEAWDLLKYLDQDRIITYDYIIEAEKTTGEKPLTKPNPYTFIKGMLGKNYSDADIVKSKYDKSVAKKTLVVGDAGADMFSAQAAGMDFAAVLTGISGQRAVKYFSDHRATYILRDITKLIE